MDDAELVLWKRYKNEGCMVSREKLINMYSDYAIEISDKIAKKCPNHVQCEDVHSEAIVGLLDSIDKFSITKLTHFKTYAFKRIWGHIVDYQRKEDYLTRTQRKNMAVIPSNISLSHVISVGNHGDAGEQYFIDVIIDNRCKNPLKEIIKKDWSFYLEDLTNEEVLIIKLYYIENQNMKDIGKVIGICESRVSQIHSSIIDRLKSKVMRLNKTYLDFV